LSRSKWGIGQGLQTKCVLYLYWTAGDGIGFPKMIAWLPSLSISSVVLLLKRQPVRMMEMEPREASMCQSDFAALWQNTCHKQLKGGSIYFSSCFRKFQFRVLGY
jgi:hypothetical protein